MPFGAVADVLVAAAAWLVLGGIGARYFRGNASLDETRADLEERKDAS